jgi:rare lipoprotein A
MIQEILRSALIVGTVVVNAVQLGSPAERMVVANQETALPINLEAPPMLSNLLNLKPLDMRLPKNKSITSGLATWYGLVLNHHRTASGERFDCDKLTGASNTLPFGTRVKVTNLKNGMSVVVRINDRGVLDPGHVIDLSSAAAEKIGMIRMGIAPVNLDILAAAS